LACCPSSEKPSDSGVIGEGITGKDAADEEGALGTIGATGDEVGIEWVAGTNLGRRGKDLED